MRVRPSPDFYAALTGLPAGWVATPIPAGVAIHPALSSAERIVMLYRESPAPAEGLVVVVRKAIPCPRRCGTRWTEPSAICGRKSGVACECT